MTIEVNGQTFQHRGILDDDHLREIILAGIETDVPVELWIEYAEEIRLDSEANA